MGQVLAILKKDLRRLWPFGAVMAAILALHGWIDLQMDHGFVKVLNTRFFNLEPFLLLVAWWCLVGVLIQQEPSIGDRQYWVSRPISRLSILAAKALFLVIFVCAPNFLAQGVVLNISGFPPSACLGSLIWNQGVIFVYFVVAAAFASVTRNFRQYAVTSLVVFVIGGFLDQKQANSPGGQWMGVQWVAELAVQGALLLGGVAVLAIQYRLRRPGAARLALSATVVAVLFLILTPWWHTAFEVTAAMGVHDDGASRIRMASESAPIRTEHSGIDGFKRLAFPVRITGIPKGRELTSERIMVTLRAPGTEEWHSAWLPRNVIATHSEWRNDDDWLAEDGLYWLSFDIPAAALERVKDKPVNVDADIAFSLFSSPTITRLPSNPRAFPVPDAGHCTLERPPGFTMLNCVNPFRTQVSLNLRVQPRAGEPRRASSCCEISYSPFPAGGKFSVWELFGSSPSSGLQLSNDDEMSAEVRRPVSFFERHLVIDDIRLAPLQVGRSRP